jgi:hypothetical protein
MLSPSSNLFTKDRFFYSVIFLLSAARVLTSKVRACPQYFDCESYLAMMQSIQYDPAIPGHHAMRVLPALFARGLNLLGFSPATSFQIISGASYCLLGVGVYWFVRQEKQAPWVALAFTLLCLAPHHAMRIPLQLVYQSCDMMTYLFTLAIIYCSLKNRLEGIFVLSLFGILTRQNVFVLGELSLLYCFCRELKLKTALYAVLLGAAYFSLQIYYHASGVFSDLLHPPEGYFTFSHLLHIFIESGLLELVLPIIPFLVLSFQPILLFFRKHWHLAIYGAIVVGQPLLGYHMTGNNFQRLALQGVWVLFLVCALTWPTSQQSKERTIALVLYSLAVYFMWGMPQRLVLVVLFSVVLLMSRYALFSFIPKRL